MIDLNSKRQKKISNILNSLISNGAHINKNVTLKEINSNNIGFTALDNINPLNKLISIPHKLLISKKVFKDFLIKEEVNLYDEKLIELYFSILPDLNFFKNNNFYFMKDDDKKISLSFFNENSPIKKNIIEKFNKFYKLGNEYEKYIFLLFSTRSFTINKESFLTPLLDSMNFNFFNKSYFYDNDIVYLNNNNQINKNEEIFQSYNLKTDPINFFVQYSFYPENYKNITFSKNQFILNVSNYTNLKIDQNFWFKNNDQTISNKNPISFYNYEIPLIINLMFEKLTTDHKIISKVVNNFMNLVKKQFNIEILEKFLLNKENQKKTVLFNFAKSIKLYCLNLDKIIENSKI